MDEAQSWITEPLIGCERSRALAERIAALPGANCVRGILGALLAA